MKDKKKELRDYLLILLWIGVILASIKSLFTDTGFDNAYTVAMSYRHLRGDTMFSQMWEPHQTSIFFTDILMWLYHLVVPTYTGVMLYLQVCGTLFFAAVCIPIYKLFKELTDPYIAQLACMFFMMFRAKQTPFPDFANLQIAFSVLVFLLLVKYFRDETKVRYLVLAGLMLCLEVLSYPSCLLAYFFAAAAIFIYSQKKLKSFLIFTGVCAASGMAYVSVFLVKMGLPLFLENVKNVYLSDSHSDDYISLHDYFYGVALGAVWILVSLLLALTVKALVNHFGRKWDLLPVLGAVMTVSELVMLVFRNKTGLDWTCVFYVIPLFLMFLGCLGFDKMTTTERFVWGTGMLLSLASFFATLLLTDLGLITIVAYLVLGGLVSFLPIRYMKRSAQYFLMFILCLIVLHRGLVVWGYSNKDNRWMVYEINAIVRKGPSLGIVTDYMTYYMNKTNMDEHPRFISEEDNYLLVCDGFLIDSMEFLITPGNISNWSTIDTPIYNECLLDYYRLHPEKTPDVVAMSCWYGQMLVPADSFVMEWVEENYEPAGDGSYWRYFRKKTAGAQ